MDYMRAAGLIRQLVEHFSLITTIWCGLVWCDTVIGGWSLGGVATGDMSGLIALLVSPVCTPAASLYLMQRA